MQLIPEVEKRVDLLFSPDEQHLARTLLVEYCEVWLPGPQWGESAQNRILFSILKLSAGDLSKLENALGLAYKDWRDLLVAADFANDIKIHESWLPNRTW